VFDILQVVPGKKKLTQSGWHSFNAICCHNRGHKADRRGRGGIRMDGENWSYHCFNCGFKCGFILGKPITKNTRQLFSYCGVDKEQVDKWSFESLQHKDLLDFVKVKKEKKKIKFKETHLPEEAELITTDNPKHSMFVQYLNKRKVNDYPFMCTPDMEGRQANRIIIPFTYENKIVGHTSRYLDDRKPKFISEQQSGYLFGVDLQKPEWQVCIVVEGIFDALSINGCALTTNAISDTQAEILKQMNKKIIVVPDQDKSGLELIDKALDYGFYVSMPNWEEGIKDVNDSVIKYGKLATLLSILQSATNSKIKLEIKRKQLDKQRLQY
jgi:5S rRNA maturation endonuclease (ribonuclease M5)